MLVFFRELLIKRSLFTRNLENINVVLFVQLFSEKPKKLPYCAKSTR